MDSTESRSLAAPPVSIPADPTSAAGYSKAVAATRKSIVAAKRTRFVVRIVVPAKQYPLI